MASVPISKEICCLQPKISLDIEGPKDLVVSSGDLQPKSTQKIEAAQDNDLEWSEFEPVDIFKIIQHDLSEEATPPPVCSCFCTRFCKMAGPTFLYIKIGGRIVENTCFFTCMIRGTSTHPAGHAAHRQS